MICRIIFLSVWMVFFSAVFNVPFSTGQSHQNLTVEQVVNTYLYGNPDSVFAQIENILASEPVHPTANILKGLILIRTGDLQQKRLARDLIEKYTYKEREDAFSNYALEPARDLVRQPVHVVDLGRQQQLADVGEH